MRKVIKMKRKVTRILLFALMVVVVTSLSVNLCYAYDTITSPGEGSEHTLMTRVWEFVLDNKSETLTFVGDVAIVFFGLYNFIRSGGRVKRIENDLRVVRGDTSGTCLSQNSVVDAVNNMIAGYDEMRIAYEKYQNTEDDRNKLVGAVMLQNTAILEMFSVVYVNNKNLPQGVKDLINLKYAHCLEALDDDESLRGIVESVRNRIGTNKEIAEEENSTAEV